MPYSNVLSRAQVTNVASPAAETVIYTTPVMSSEAQQLQGVGQQSTGPFPVRITANLSVTEGTSGTAFLVKCRQGASVASPQIGPTYTVTNAAAATNDSTCIFEDSSGWLAQQYGGQYVITVAQTGATVAGTVVVCDVQVEQ
jgi:hypothetical protein